MIVTGEIDKIREERWANPGLSWGTVLTMGSLHDGHLSLVRRAREENDRLSVSIFINPTQFGSSKDLLTYPHDIDRDIQLLAGENVDLVFVPSEDLMYPPGYQTKILVEKVAQPLEGAARSGHFSGVATIVAKLFNILEPDRAYFGQKDAQQAIVISRMVKDLNFKVDIMMCPIIRESDGLAMSSRNVRLSLEQRIAASVLHKALEAAEKRIISGETNAESLREQMRRIIHSEPLAKLDYVSVADPRSLEEVEEVDSGVLLSLAVYFGDVRLIDNILIGGDILGAKSS
ncbi:MAG: pantoate--beta-alanine ligase [Anaerolineae bacterium]|nr:MAG: pantoate--beta-alanine ligase [Anaerolineae bacterium]